MGCGSTHTLPEEALLKPMTLSLVLPKTSSSSLNHAFAILRSITKFRNRFLLIYHKLLYTTGACVFINPTIILCVHCVFYKIDRLDRGRWRLFTWTVLVFVISDDYFDGRGLDNYTVE